MALHHQIARRSAIEPQLAPNLESRLGVDAVQRPPLPDEHVRKDMSPIHNSDSVAASLQRLADAERSLREAQSLLKKVVGKDVGKRGAHEFDKTMGHRLEVPTSPASSEPASNNGPQQAWKGTAGIWRISTGVAANQMAKQVELKQEKILDAVVLSSLQCLRASQGSSADLQKASVVVKAPSFNHSVSMATLSSDDLKQIPDHGSYATTAACWQKGRCGSYGVPLIHPSSPGALMWLMFGLICMVYEAVAIPADISFDFDKNVGALLFIHATVNLYFILDVPLTFVTAFVNKDGLLVIDVQTIARRYARTWLIFDTLAAIPWEWVDIGAEMQITRSIKVLRLIRLVPRLVKLKHRLATTYNFFDGNSVLILGMGIIRNLAIMLLTAHLCACAWYAVGKFKSDIPSWIEIYSDRYMADFSEKAERYVWSLYFTVATMTTVGYGDISPQNYNEAIFGLFLLPIASVSFATMMGTLGDIIGSINSSGRRKAEKKLRLIKFLTHRQVPRTLTFRLKEYLLYLWEEKADFDTYEEEVKAILPSSLKEDLCWHLYGAALQWAPFLDFMKGYPVCMRQLSSMVRIRYLERGDHVFRVGQKNKEMYILLVGSVFVSLNQCLREGIAANDCEVSQAAKKLRNTLSEFTKNVSSAGTSAFGVDASSTRAILVSAGFKLQVNDMHQRRSARMIQKAWRKRRGGAPVRIPSGGGSETEKGSLHGGVSVLVQSMKSRLVHAPAYFGEACLWAPIEKWDDIAPSPYLYGARCNTRVELLGIDRSAVQVVIEAFSPWLGERFEFFRRAVLESLAAMWESMDLPAESPNSNSLRQLSTGSNGCEPPEIQAPSTPAPTLVSMSSDKLPGSVGD